MKVCSVESCERRSTRRGWCEMHYRRWKQHGSPLHVGYRRGEDHPDWVGDKITYKGAHRRVYRLRGSASDHRCVRCDAPAREWAYDHADPDELTNELGHAYSADPLHYLPMCNPCHQVFDRRKEIA